MQHKLHHLIVIVLSIASIVFLQIGFIFLLLGMLPSIMAWFLDDTPKKDLYKTVRATNIAGIFPSLMKLTQSSHPDAALQIAMQTPSVWMQIYGTAALGFILVWVCRWAAYFSISASSHARAKELEKAQKELVAEWGDSITEFVIKESESTTPAAA